MLFYRKIHYLTRIFHVKLHAKTDIDSCDIGFQVGIIHESGNGFSLNHI